MNKAEINNGITINNKHWFNFKKFKAFKKQLNEYLKKQYNETLNVLFNDKAIREAVFKYILWFDWETDVFNSWRKDKIWDLALSNKSVNIITELKEHTKEILYK